VSLPASEGKGMSPTTLDAVLRAFAAQRTRRSALGAVIAAVLATWFFGASDARKNQSRWKTKRRKNSTNGKRNKNRKNKGKKKQKKGKNKNCKVRHSEQQIIGFIKQAAKKYGQSEDVMIRVARCESTLNPCAVNPAGPYYGLFQYLKSTWKSTPYGDRDIFDPEAQALATGWMWKQGRKNEWACK
jgi:hypothetical protein